MEEALAIAAEIGSFPLIIRPAFTLGGTGARARMGACGARGPACGACGAHAAHERGARCSPCTWRPLQHMRRLLRPLRRPLGTCTWRPCGPFPMQPRPMRPHAVPNAIPLWLGGPEAKRRRQAPFECRAAARSNRRPPTQIQTQF